MFHVLWKNPLSKHFGSLGLIITFGVCVYYIYLEAWTLGYAWFEMTGRFSGIATREEMGTFLTSFQGLKSSSYFDGMGTVYSFFLLSFAVNVYVLWYGIRGGIEKLCNIGLPLLFIMALVLVIRVFTLDSPDPMHPENSVVSGLGFVWNPDFSQLRNAKIWLAAAGQFFFTLSVGFGCIQTYASYLDRKKDVTLNGLTAAISNEVAEVVCGGSIAIPIAVAFF
ncbi:MAG: sodium:calcium symporter, partial [Deltaproteobacteria bacterium]|nr:sodium:calcium symporter [Deltaproteobacteria bacterium]